MMTATKEEIVLGDSYHIDSGPHMGHDATVVNVRFRSSRSKVKIVSVECSCGGSWSYEDVPPYNML